MGIGRALQRGFFLLLGSLFGSALTNTAHALTQDDWTFTPGYAVKLPKGWKVLSQSEVEGVGFELIVGRSLEDYLRVFMSGDELKTAEFRKRMSSVVASAKKDMASSLLSEPKVVPFGKDGARLSLVFRTEIRGKPVFEAHFPLAVGGKGLDLHYVGPLARSKESLKELESLVQNLKPYWTGDAHAPQAFKPAATR